MKFNFPKQEAVLIHTKLTPKMFAAIKDIAEKEQCLRADVITTLLEAAIEEYYKQTKPEQVIEARAFPLPPDKENSPDEEMPRPKPQGTTPEHPKAVSTEQYITCPNPKCHRVTKSFAPRTGKTVDGNEYCSDRCAKMATEPKQQRPQLTDKEKRERKKAYQREYMRNYYRRKLSSKPPPMKQRPDLPDEQETGLTKEQAEHHADIQDEMETEFFSTPLADDVEVVFCQNAACNKRFPRKDGVSDGKFTFCSQKCLDYFASAGEDDADEDYSYTNSLPKYTRN
jgi:hypothetical protein